MKLVDVLTSGYVSYGKKNQTFCYEGYRLHFCQINISEIKIFFMLYNSLFPLQNGYLTIFK